MCACVRGGEFEQYKDFVGIKNVTAKIKELLNKVKNKKQEQIDKVLDKLGAKVRKLKDQLRALSLIGAPGREQKKRVSKK